MNGSVCRGSSAVAAPGLLFAHLGLYLGPLLEEQLSMPTGRFYFTFFCVLWIFFKTLALYSIKILNSRPCIVSAGTKIPKSNKICHPSKKWNKPVADIMVNCVAIVKAITLLYSYQIKTFIRNKELFILEKSCSVKLVLVIFTQHIKTNCNLRNTNIQKCRTIAYSCEIYQSSYIFYTFCCCWVKKAANMIFDLFHF